MDSPSRFTVQKDLKPAITSRKVFFLPRWSTPILQYILGAFLSYLGLLHQSYSLSNIGAQKLLLPTYLLYLFKIRIIFMIYMVESLKIIMFTNSHQIQKIVSDINALKSCFFIVLAYHLISQMQMQPKLISISSFNFSLPSGLGLPFKVQIIKAKKCMMKE